MTKKADSTKHPSQRKISNEVYKAEVSRLQSELVKLQESAYATPGRGSSWSSRAVTPPARAARSSG